jgi:hypothetical protein
MKIRRDAFAGLSWPGDGDAYLAKVAPEASPHANLSRHVVMGHRKDS